MEIKLSQAEMCEAVEYWLSRVILFTPVVIEKMTQTMVNQHSHFDIKTQDRKIVKE